MLTYSKLHKVLIVLSEHVQKEVGHLQLPKILHVPRVVSKVGQVGQHLFFRLCWRETSYESN